MGKWFEDFKKLTTEEEKNEFAQIVNKTGFSAINDLTRSFHDELKKIEENEFELMRGWIELGKKLLPDLLRFSPNWEYFWDETMQTLENKANYYQEIPAEERDGEWQVLFDNPFSTDGIVCHPEKSFTEAAYLAAKYLLHLKKAEIVKLQKVTHTIMKRGK